MSMTCTITSPPRFKYAMSETGDKEDRKREYNRLAQREFRRRRKEHLKSLEQGRVEQTSEQAAEIDRLRRENLALKKEIQTLKQTYGSPNSSSSVTHMSVPTLNHHERSYSLSPSITSTMDSLSHAGSPQPDLLSMRNLSMTSAMLPPSMNAFVDPLPLPTLHSQPYSMVQTSSMRHNAQSSQGSPDYGSSQPAMGPDSFQSLNLNPVSSRMPPPPPPETTSHGTLRSNLMTMTPYDKSKARAEIIEIFRPLVSDTANLSNTDKHLATLRSMSDTLPTILKPTKEQLIKPHYFGIDMLASPSLRDLLIGAGNEVAESFITGLGSCGGNVEDVGQLTIWGEDPLDEMSWEFSQYMLSQWGWLLGPSWVNRANFWRKQRGAPMLPDTSTTW